MTTQVFPTLSGLTYPFDRTPIFDTIIQANVSGKEVRLANQIYPRYQWDLIYSMLRQGVSAGVAYTELQQLMGFYNQMQGSFNSFLFQDPDDNAVTGQAIGTGDGATTTFQLVRAMGGYVEPVQAPNLAGTIHIYVNGALKTVTTDYTISGWGSANPGVVTFTTAPGNTLPITADFGFYFPVRFVNDQIPFSKWIGNMYEAKKISLMSVKN